MAIVGQKWNGKSKRGVSSFSLCESMAYKTSNRRLNHESSRTDILTNIVDKVKTGEVSKEELTAHASTLV